MTGILRPVLLAVCLLAASAQAAPQEDLEKLRKRISALQQEFDKTNESKVDAADALRDSERAISDSSRKLHRLGQRQAEAQQELDGLQRQSARLQHEIAAQQAALGRLLYQQYLNGGDQEYLRLLLNNRDPNQTARELRYYGYIARERADTLAALRANLARLDAISAQTRARSAEIATLQQEERTQRRQLEQERRTHQQALARVAQQLKEQRREIGRLQRNENRLTQLMEKLSRVLPDQVGGAAFRSLKGKLPLPVRGKPANRFGTRRPESSLQWTGWFMPAPPSQPVKAVAAGRVVYADWLRGFGNLLIVDHGDGYMSLYGNNETLYKQVGDSLRGGETVAAVGRSGGNEDSGLYFELRFEGKPMDPTPWVRR